MTHRKDGRKVIAADHVVHDKTDSCKFRGGALSTFQCSLVTCFLRRKKFFVLLVMMPPPGIVYAHGKFRTKGKLKALESAWKARRKSSLGDEGKSSSDFSPLNLFFVPYVG